MIFFFKNALVVLYLNLIDLGVRNVGVQIVYPFLIQEMIQKQTATRFFLHCRDDLGLHCLCEFCGFFLILLCKWLRTFLKGKMFG